MVALFKYITVIFSTAQVSRQQHRTAEQRPTMNVHVGPSGESVVLTSAFVGECATDAATLRAIIAHSPLESVLALLDAWTALVRNRPEDWVKIYHTWPAAAGLAGVCKNETLVNALCNFVARRVINKCTSNARIVAAQMRCLLTGSDRYALRSNEINPNDDLGALFADQALRMFAIKTAKRFFEILKRQSVFCKEIMSMAVRANVCTDAHQAVVVTIDGAQYHVPRPTLSSKRLVRAIQETALSTENGAVPDWLCEQIDAAQHQLDQVEQRLDNAIGLWQLTQECGRKAIKNIGFFEALKPEQDTTQQVVLAELEKQHKMVKALTELAKHEESNTLVLRATADWIHTEVKIVRDYTAWKKRCEHTTQN
ncbi:MAG: hypothetical protein CL678_00780 [Bdellovibrionaceae bacterium]|nr:hypothetical protein [Pseudobdellovibrionaceae bacterium]